MKLYDAIFDFIYSFFKRKRRLVIFNYFETKLNDIWKEICENNKLEKNILIKVSSNSEKALKDLNHRILFHIQVPKEITTLELKKNIDKLNLYFIGNARIISNLSCDKKDENNYHFIIAFISSEEKLIKDFDIKK